MAVAYTDTVVNYSGLLKTKSDNSTRLVDGIYAMGRPYGDGIVSTGTRKIASTEFTLASSFTIPTGTQPAITESGSVTASAGDVITRAQVTNVAQIFQEAVEVSYLKQSATGSLGGVNLANAVSNVTNELDFQVAGKMSKIKKDLDYTYINGAYVKSTSNATAYKSRGLITGLTTNAATYANGGAISASTINSAIKSAMANGFDFVDGRMILWCNPGNLETINTAYTGLTGFGMPRTRTEGGVAINSIMTNFGNLIVDYDVNIPEKTYLILNMNELAIAELDVQGKGCWFYEDLAKNGAAERGQIYGQAGIDYGAEWAHIKITEAAE